MRIAICDDEEEIRIALAEKLKKMFPSSELSAYSSGAALLAAPPPDILLLDIQMPGRSGMETARELRRRNGKMILIFVTALEEYVFQAFDVGAFHYLVKPFSDEKFAAVLQNAVRQYQSQTAGTQEPDLLIKAGGVHTRVRRGDVLYAEVFNRKVLIHSTQGDIEYYGRLSSLERQAGEDFFRSHRAYLVHFKYVVKYDSSTIYLEKGSALMAKQRYRDFVKQYLRYNGRQAENDG